LKKQPRTKRSTISQTADEDTTFTNLLNTGVSLITTKGFSKSWLQGLGEPRIHLAAVAYYRGLELLRG
jgi:hypothetical protein